MAFGDELDAYLKARKRVLLRPDKSLVPRDVLPLPIFTESDWTVVDGPYENARRLRDLAHAFTACGVVDFRVIVRSLRMPSPNRCVAHVHLFHAGETVRPGTLSDLVYYLDRREGLLKTAMVEVRSCPAYDLTARRFATMPY